MKVLLTGGGTLGSVTPLLAIVEAWRVRDTAVEFLWIGTPKGPERELVQDINHISFCQIPVARLSRHISSELLMLPFHFLKAVWMSFQIIKSEKPNAVIGAGGFTQVPVMFAAWILHIKCFALQTDVDPLLATRLVVPFVNKIFVAWQQTVCCFSKNKIVVLGVPVRKSMLNGSKKNKTKPNIFIFGGGTGAQWLNERIYEIAPQLCRDFDVLHLTGVGKRTELSPIEGYRVVESLGKEMADAYASADLVIARAGMGTIAELSALHKAAILIPLPHSAQEKNAEVLGDAVLVLDQKITSSLLLDQIRSLLVDEISLQKYRDSIKNVLRTNVADDIIEEVVASSK